MSMAEKNKKKNTAVQIGGGFGAVVLIGGVLAATALAAAAFIDKRKGRRSVEGGGGTAPSEICHKSKNQEEVVVLDGPSTADSSEDSSGSDTAIFDQDSNVMLVSAVTKLENGESECSSEKINSMKDDEMVGTENSASCDLECSTDKDQLPKNDDPIMDEDVNLMKGDEDSYQQNKPSVENGDTESSIEKIETPGQYRTEVLSNDDVVDASRTVPDRKNEVFFTCVVNKTLDAQSMPGVGFTQDRISDVETETETDLGTGDSCFSWQVNGQCVEDCDAECSIEKVQTSTLVNLQSKEPAIETETYEVLNDDSTTEFSHDETTRELIQHESRRIFEETAGKLSEDALAKKNDSSSFPSSVTAASGVRFLFAKYARISSEIVDPTKRRVSMAALLAVASSVLLSYLLEVSFAKLLCVVGFLTVVLFEIRAL